MSTTITKPSTTIKVNIQGHEFDINYPKSGQMIDIANIKSKLSDGHYAQLLFQRSNEADMAIKLIDAFCFFSIMIPNLKKSLEVTSLYDLEILQSTELIHVYDNKVSPWLDSWTEAINNRLTELKGEETGNRALV